MSDKLAIVGATASIVTLVEVTFEVIARLNDTTDTARNIPGTLRPTLNCLPVIAKSLKAIESQPVAQDPDLRRAISSFQQDLEAFEALVQKILPHRDDTLLRLFLKFLHRMFVYSQIAAATTAFESYKSTLGFYLSLFNIKITPAAQTVLVATAATIRDRFFNCCRPRQDPGLLAASVASDDYIKVRDGLLSRKYTLAGTAIISAARETPFDGWMTQLVSYLADELYKKGDAEVVIWLNRHTVPLLLKRLNVAVPHDDNVELQTRKVWDTFRAVLEDWGRSWLVVLDCRALDASEAMRDILFSLPRSEKQKGYVLVLEDKASQILPRGCCTTLTMSSQPTNSRMHMVRDMIQGGRNKVANFFSTRRLEDLFKISRPERDDVERQLAPDAVDTAANLHLRRPSPVMLSCLRARSQALLSQSRRRAPSVPHSRGIEMPDLVGSSPASGRMTTVRLNAPQAEQPYTWNGFDWKDAIV